MVRSLLPLVSLAAVLPALVAAHGQLRGVTIAGVWADAPNIYFDGDSRNQNTPIRKGYQASSPSYLLPTNFADDNKMACEEAGPAPGVFVVHPGDEVKWKWEGATPELSNAGFPQGTWVHAMGPTMTYIAKCPGSCKDANPADLGWTKIDFNGLNPGNIDDKLRSAMDSKPEPYRSQGLWALAQMIENDSQYSSFVPQGLENGEYILRSDISAVHNPFNGDPSSGPQNYVGCLQVRVENGGNVKLPAGTKAGSLYAPDGDLARYSVFTSPATFAEPGPPKWDGASAGSSDSGNSGNNGQQNQDQGNQNQGSGNNGGSSGSDNPSNGQQGGSTDNGNNGQQQNQDQGNQNQGGSNGSNGGGSETGGNSSTTDGNGAKQCRRRSSKRSVSGRSKVARSLHVAHKRHH